MKTCYDAGMENFIFGERKAAQSSRRELSNIAWRMTSTFCRIMTGSFILMKRRY
ncbi:hypothetical protein COOONC_06578 [Cooperia oncophora]